MPGKKELDTTRAPTLGFGGENHDMESSMRHVSKTNTPTEPGKPCAQLPMTQLSGPGRVFFCFCFFSSKDLKTMVLGELNGYKKPVTQTEREASA